jgi:hypothetical protein
MLMPDPHHALWCDFKHVQLRLDSVLCYQPGASGNCLAGQMGAGWSDVNERINEYDSHVPWLELDSQSVDPTTHADVRNLDVLYGIAAGMAHMIDDWQQGGIAMSHEPPLVTYHALDFHTQELIVVGTSAEDYWVVESLRWYKSEFNTNYEKRNFLIPNIIQRNRFGKQINTGEYARMLRIIAQETKALIHGTPFSWYYYLDSKADGHDPCDIAVFYDYMRQHWMKPHSWQHWNCGYLQQSRDWCRAHVDIYTEIDYRALFFGLQRPTQGRLSAIDLRAVADYSQRNFHILFKLRDLAPPEHRDHMHGRIKTLEKQLYNARMLLG